MRARMALALGLGALTLGGCQTCGTVQCVGQAERIVFGVMTWPATVVNGVQATLTGPVTVTMSCAPQGSQTSCMWPYQLVVTAGTYALQVSAPGYQTTTVQAEVTLTPGTCGCTASSFEPSTVVLSSADAGAD
jgi:hypothetical protein